MKNRTMSTMVRSGAFLFALSTAVVTIPFSTEAQTIVRQTAGQHTAFEQDSFQQIREGEMRQAAQIADSGDFPPSILDGSQVGSTLEDTAPSWRAPARPHIAGAGRLRAPVSVSRADGTCGDAIIGMVTDRARGLLSISFSSGAFSDVAMSEGARGITLWRGGRLVSAADLFPGGVSYDLDMRGGDAAEASGPWRIALHGSACGRLDLASNIDSKRSFADFTFDGDDLVLLSAVHHHFDLLSWQGTITYIAPNPNEESTLAAMSRMTERFGAMAGRRGAGAGPKINVIRPGLAPATSNADFPGLDIGILPDSPITPMIGVAEDLRGFFSERWLSEINGPYLGVYEEQGRRILVVSGRNGDELEQAAAAAFTTLPDGRAALVAFNEPRKIQSRQVAEINVAGSNAQEVSVSLIDLAGGSRIGNGESIKFTINRPVIAGDGFIRTRLGGVTEGSGSGRWRIRLNGQDSTILPISGEVIEAQIAVNLLNEGANLIEIVLDGSQDLGDVFLHPDSRAIITNVGQGETSSIAQWRQGGKGGAWVVVGRDISTIESGLNLIGARSAHLAATGGDAASVTLTRDVAAMTEANFLIGVRDDVKVALERLDAIAQRFGGENPRGLREIGLDELTPKWRASITPVAGIPAMTAITREDLEEGSRVLSALGVWRQLSGEAVGIDLDAWRVTSIADPRRISATKTENAMFSGLTRKLEVLSAQALDSIDSQGRSGRDLRDWITALAPGIMILFGGALIIALLIRMAFSKKKEE